MNEEERKIMEEFLRLREENERLKEAIRDALLDWGKVAPEDVRKRLRNAIDNARK